MHPKFSKQCFSVSEKHYIALAIKLLPAFELRERLTADQPDQSWLATLAQKLPQKRNHCAVLVQDKHFAEPAPSGPVTPPVAFAITMGLTTSVFLAAL